MKDSKHGFRTGYLLETHGFVKRVHPIVLGRVRNCDSLCPHRNPMPPPELATDAPVLNVSHPMIVNLSPTLRMESHFVGEPARLGRSGGRPVRRIRAWGLTGLSRFTHRAVGGGADGCARGGRA